MTEIINEGWKLQQLTITRAWSTANGEAEYTGRITFKNGKRDEVAFNVSPENLNAMLALVSDSIVTSAKELGQGLIQSIKTQLPAPQAALGGGSEDFIPEGGGLG